MHCRSVHVEIIYYAMNAVTAAVHTHFILAVSSMREERVNHMFYRSFKRSRARIWAPDSCAVEYSNHYINPRIFSQTANSPDSFNFWRLLLNSCCPRKTIFSWRCKPRPQTNLSCYLITKKGAAISPHSFTFYSKLYKDKETSQMFARKLRIVVTRPRQHTCIRPRLTATPTKCNIICGHSWLRLNDLHS